MSELSTVSGVEESSSAPDLPQEQVVEPVKTVYTPATNPLRRPGWRWDRVVYLTTKSGGKNRANSPFDDPIVTSTRKYLTHYNSVLRNTVRGNNPTDLDSAFQAVYVQYPDVSMAHSIYNARGFLRYAIEALVLARQSPADIAKELGCPENVIVVYEQLFYDVRDRMANELFIMDALMSPAVKHGVGGTDYDFFWKQVAYTHGAAALRSMWCIGGIDDDTRTKMEEVSKTITERNTIRAAVIRQPTQHNAREFAEEQLTREQINVNAKQPETTSEAAFLAGAAVLSSAIKMCVSGVVSGNAGAREDRAVKSLEQMAAYIDMEPVAPEHVLPVTPTEPEAQTEVKEAQPPPRTQPRQPEVTPVDEPEPSVFARKPTHTQDDTRREAKEAQAASVSSVFNRPAGPPKNSSTIGESGQRVDLTEKKNAILDRIRKK